MSGPKTFSAHYFDKWKHAKVSKTTHRCPPLGEYPVLENMLTCSHMNLKLKQTAGFREEEQIFCRWSAGKVVVHRLCFEQWVILTWCIIYQKPPPVVSLNYECLPVLPPILIYLGCTDSCFLACIIRTYAGLIAQPTPSACFIFKEGKLWCWLPLLPCNTPPYPGRPSTS